MRAKLIVAVGGLCVLAFAAYPASGAVLLYDNLSLTTGGSDPVDSFTGYGPLADSFSTGSSGFTLTDVELLLSGDNTSSGSIVVQLMSDDHTAPGTSLFTIGTLLDAALTSTPTAFDFPVPSFGLSPSTRYWIEVSSPYPTTASWARSTGEGVGTAGEYFANNAVGVASSDSEGGPYQMQVSGQVGGTVPEPTTIIVWSLLGGLGITAGWWRRWKKAA